MYGKKPNPNRPRVSVNLKGEPEYYHRQDPAMAYGANEVTFPENYGFWLASGYDIIGQEKVVGRDATVLTGKLDAYLASKHKATDYKMWVDSQTGILLKLIETNEAGEVITLIEVKEIFVNSSVDRNKFNTTAPQGAIERSNSSLTK